jgi:Domain of unknown function (DUF4386)
MSSTAVTTRMQSPIAHRAGIHASGRERNALRRTEVLVGLLFLTATVTFSVANKLIVSVLNRPDYLAGASPHTHALAAGAVLALIEGPATVGIAVLLFPLLKRTSEPLALAFIGFRIAELAAALLYVATPLMAITLSDELRNGTVHATASQQLALLLTPLHSAAILLIYLLTSLGGTILAYLLYRSRLIPRPIAILGLIGYPVLLLGTILAMFNLTSVTHGAGLTALVPGGLFELILPIWLFAKGFNDSTQTPSRRTGTPATQSALDEGALAPVVEPYRSDLANRGTLLRSG